MKSKSTSFTPRILMHLAWIRLTEHSIRTTALISTIGISVFTWIVLSTFASPFLASRAGEQFDSTLGIVNARVSGEPIPLRYAQRIGQIPGVTMVGYTAVAAFLCSDGRSAVSVNAYGGSKTVSDLRRFGASAVDVTAWNETRNGLLVDAELAQQCRLTRGMTLSPEDLLSGVEMPFHVVAILPENPDFINTGKMAFGHYEYVNQLLPEELRDQVRLISVTGDNPARLPQLAETIEREFANADPPVDAHVSSETSMLGRYGQVQELLGVVMLAMSLCMLLVFLTVTAHQVTQRRASMATLQTIGFGRGLQFGGLILELISIILAGTVLGLLAGRAILTVITPQVFWLTGQLRTPEWALWSFAPALVLLALLTLAWPALQVSKLKPIDHLQV